MRTLRILLRKELKNYLLNPFGWVILAFVIIMQGVSLSTAMKGFRDTPSQQSLIYVAFHSPLFWFYFLFIFPLITMRSFAEEARSGTLEGLLTAPVKTWHVVMGKYLAAMIFYVVLWIPSYAQFRMYEWVTHLPPAFAPGALWGSYLILFLIGCAYTAIGILASALTSSQIIAGLVTIGLLVLQWFMGFVPQIWGESFAAAPLFRYISCQEHLHYFSQGLLDTRPVVYYLSYTALILFATYQVVDFRRWRS
jgi:ABC-2 type transport system permease protein